jgi:anti-sigma B factor antagonist
MCGALRGSRLNGTRAGYVRRFIASPDPKQSAIEGDPMSHQGCCSSQPAGDLAEVLTLDGAFDRSNAVQVELALGDAGDADKRQLVIDLRGVSFLDSTMLRVLIQGLVDTVARGAQLALIRPNATVWRVFVLTGLSHSFHSFGRLDEALASFGLRT